MSMCLVPDRTGFESWLWVQVPGPFSGFRVFISSVRMIVTERMKWQEWKHTLSIYLCLSLSIYIYAAVVFPGVDFCQVEVRVWNRWLCKVFLPGFKSSSQLLNQFRHQLSSPQPQCFQCRQNLGVLAWMPGGWPCIHSGIWHSSERLQAGMWPRRAWFGSWWLAQDAEATLVFTGRSVLVGRPLHLRVCVLLEPVWPYVNSEHTQGPRTV